MLTTKENVKSLLEITGTDHDAVLDSLIGGVTAFIESHVNRKFTGPVTEYRNGSGDHIFLAAYPVAAISSLEKNTGTQASPVWTAIPASSYNVILETGQIINEGVIPEGYRNIKIVYTVGAVPADIELVARELVAKMFEQRHAQGKKSESMGEANVSWETNLTEMQKATLASYRKMNV